mmetsp:Transcript_41808/g.78192  ORF Transcript_41808/g.78192 Transcript_41808/m.78192 type:complete len:86 (-) Transcript_41808:808-1065(-)
MERSEGGRRWNQMRSMCQQQRHLVCHWDAAAGNVCKKYSGPSTSEIMHKRIPAGETQPETKQCAQEPGGGVWGSCAIRLGPGINH